MRHLGLVPIPGPHSNHDPRFVRNRVRHELLPLLDDIAGRDTVPLLVRTATLARRGSRHPRVRWRGDRPDRRPSGCRGCHAGSRSPRLRRWLARRGLPARRGEREPGLGGGQRRAQGRASSPGGRRVERHRQRLRIVTGHRDNLVGRYESHSGQRSQLMATRLRGRWALGHHAPEPHVDPQGQAGDLRAAGGYGENHRRVRGQEEIIWIREHGFGCVVSIIPAPHNLHNYEELGMRRSTARSTATTPRRARSRSTGS